jgi:hypothetical protein
MKLIKTESDSNMDKDLVVVVVGILSFFTILMVTAMVSDYLTNEQTIACVEVAKTEVLAMRCFN